MFQLIAVVMAIAVTAFVVVGGVSYFNADTGTRIKTQQMLQGHFDGLATAISTYRSANNDFLADDIAALNGLLPGGSVPRLSTAPDAFNWSLATLPAAGEGYRDVRVLCFSTTDIDAVSTGVMLGIASFLNNVMNTRGNTSVEAGAVCTASSAFSGPLTADDLRSKAQNSRLAIVFKGL